MLCSFGAFVTDAARDEMESSSCSLKTTPSLMLSKTSVFGTKGNCLVFKKSGPSPGYWIAKLQRTYHACHHLPDCHKWQHWSTLVFSRISLTQYAMEMGCLLVEFILFQMMVLSVHIKTLSTVTVNAHRFPFLNAQQGERLVIPI